MRPSCTWLAKTCVVYTRVFVEELQISRNCDVAVLLTVGGWGGVIKQQGFYEVYIQYWPCSSTNSFELLLDVFFPLGSSDSQSKLMQKVAFK